VGHVGGWVPYKVPESGKKKKEGASNEVGEGTFFKEQKKDLAPLRKMCFMEKRAEGKKGEEGKKDISSGEGGKGGHL